MLAIVVKFLCTFRVCFCAVSVCVLFFYGPCCLNKINDDDDDDDSSTTAHSNSVTRV